MTTQSSDLLPGAAVRRRYGVSDMAIWRWLHDPKIGFPQPLKIGTRNYWRLAELEAFERKCVAKSPERKVG